MVDLLQDPAAAEDAVVVVEDDGLAGGDAAFGVLEAHADSVCVESIDFGGDALVLRADFHGAGESGGEVVGEPIDLVGFEFWAFEFVAGSHDDALRVGFNTDDVTGFSECDAESFSLADRELLEARMFAENGTRRIDQLSGGVKLATFMSADEGSVVVKRK